MKKIIVSLVIAFAAFAADPPAAAPAPELTKDQRLEIRELQLKITQMDSQRVQLESQYKEITTELKKQSEELSALVAKVTPKGYVMQADLKFTPEKKDEAKK